jgi:ribosomal protein S18 acetylase RimI-like enzyme
MLRVKSTSGETPRLEEFMRWVSELYRSDHYPPHCYLVYDLIYEPERAEVILDSADRPSSYMLVYRAGRWIGVHVWGPRGYELVRELRLDPSKPVVVELYSDEQALVDRVVERLRSLGYVEVSIRRFHDMVCTPSSFNPAPLEGLAVRVTPDRVEDFVAFKRRGGFEVDYEEAKALLTKRLYYGVYVDRELVSAGAVCLRLPELGIVCDVHTLPEHRGRGYAKAVTSAATRSIVCAGATALLCVEEGNEPAMRVYRKLGYRVLRTRTWVFATPPTSR